MPLTKQFKILIVALFIVTTFSGIAGMILVDTLPTILQDYISQIDNEYASGEFGILEIILAFAGILSVVVIIGIWQFKNWARHSYVALSIALLPFYYIDGPIIMNPLESLFNDFSFMIDGVLIYMMYLTPLSNEFKLKANKNEETNTNPQAV